MAIEHTVEDVAIIFRNVHMGLYMIAQENMTRDGKSFYSRELVKREYGHKVTDMVASTIRLQTGA